MYSVHQPVMPKGLNFCIINGKGDILYHSESHRSLQENLLDETADNQSLYHAIDHRDSVQLNVRLYEKDVKLLITPMKGLPYALVTYYDKRYQHLFTRHIIAFTFLCQSIVLTLLSLFILFFYFSNKRFSKLLFSPINCNGLNPIPEKKLLQNNNCLSVVYSSDRIFSCHTRT